jgi:hypothetical protein
MLSSPLVRLLEAADDELRDAIVAALRGYGDNVLGCLMPALRSAAALPAAARRPAGLDVVVRDCAERLSVIIARPLRDEDDWAIAWTGCGCDLAARWGRFSVPGRGGSSSGRWRPTGCGTCTPGSTRPERSVLLCELLLRHPELAAEAEEITSTLLVVESDQELADEITARLRAHPDQGRRLRRCSSDTSDGRRRHAATESRPGPGLSYLQHAATQTRQRRSSSEVMPSLSAPTRWSTAT